MIDLISRQAALIKRFESALLEHKDGSFILCTPEFVSMVVEILNALKAQQWIPCSERLPEDDDYRPCYWHDDGAVWWINDIGQMGIGWYYTSTRTWAYYDEISAREEYVGNVVAWMPLPEPYKGEE